jgi:hypothetical protein
MTKARCRLVDTSVSRWYHCVSRCCRKAHLLSDENGFQRKDWIDQRLKGKDKKRTGIFLLTSLCFWVMI